MDLTDRTVRGWRARAATAVLTVLATALAACSANDPAASGTSGAGGAAQSGTRTLEVWTPETGTRLELVRRQAAAFSAKHPNVMVNVTVRDFGSYPAQLKLALSSEEPPDVVIGNLGWSLDGPLARARLIRDLGPWVAKYGWESRFSAAALRQQRFSPDGRAFGQGALFGVPYAADVIGWFYNARKLAALRLEVPQTFAQLESAFETARVARETPIMLGNRPQWPGLHLFYLISADLATTREVEGIVFGDRSVAWTDANFVASARKLAEWQSRGYVVAGANGLTPADANARFARGDAVFLPAGTWNAAELAAAMQDDVGFFLTPPREAGGTRRATGSIGYGWHITTASRQADLAAEFIDFMTSPDFARQLAADGDLPAFALPDAASTGASRVARDMRAAWDSVLENDALLPYLDFSAPNGAEVLYPTMQSILAGVVEPARGLADIEASRRQFLDSLR